MDLDLDALLSPGRSQPVLAANGMVATGQPLAASVGLDVLREGGNAVDAAVAMGAALTVVEPASSSIGGDAFALVWDGERLHGLNGSGRAPAALSADLLRSGGQRAVPDHGWASVTVPGAPAAWRDLHDRFGRLPFARLFEPAIRYADQGHPASPVSAWAWRRQVDAVHPQLAGEEYAAFGTLFAPGGSAPGVGETWRSADMARTLRLIAETGAGTVYRGEIAERIVTFAHRTGGYLSAEDLASHTSTWVEPISTTYRGYDVWELPPNGQGIAALVALNILEGFDLAALPRGGAQSLHLQVEAMKLAFADAHRYVADPERASIPVAELLSPAYAAQRRALITDRALLAEAGEPAGSDTVYVCAADGDGMMVSFIQSAYSGFGSHVVVPGTGIALQNRGACFSLEPGHPNELQGGKRPFHTIIPGFLTRDGVPMGPFGVMGGHMQPQGHLQVIVNTIDHRLDPQASLDQPRWRWSRDRVALFEPAVDPAVLEELRRRGHEARVEPEREAFGRGQIIWRLPSGAFIAGSDVRADGQAAGY